MLLTCERMLLWECMCASLARLACVQRARQACSVRACSCARRAAEQREGAQARQPTGIPGAHRMIVGRCTQLCAPEKSPLFGSRCTQFVCTEEKSLFGNNPMAPVWVGCERGDFRNEYDQTTWQLARSAHSRCRSSRSPRTSRWCWRFAQTKTEHAHVGVAHEAALGRKDPPILRLVTAPKFREAREKTRKHETTLNLSQVLCEFVDTAPSRVRGCVCTQDAHTAAASLRRADAI